MFFHQDLVEAAMHRPSRKRSIFELEGCALIREATEYESNRISVRTAWSCFW
jgi:hypothetical protein